ncbi:SdpI family protein [Maricaulis sp.]|uniref:SdpI family protein n=1 Tax=Maricaulis sp. TaxID=1486257 RepID=UPI0025BAEB90|nr:SdpI family protein [Maricaulis sp.]
MRNALIRSAALIAPALLLAALGWFGTDGETRIPVHWGVDGQPDRYGGRAEAFLLLPAVMIGLSAVFAVLPAIDPRGRNLERSRVVLNTAWLGALVLLLALQAAFVALGLGWIANEGVGFVPMLTLAAVGALFVLLGNVLGKARPNWFVGVRTPWTLSSDLAWDKTHRLTGRLMVLAGLAILVSIWFVPPERQVFLVLVLALTPAVVGMVYSYLVWRSDPDRQTATPDEVD